MSIDAARDQLSESCGLDVAQRQKVRFPAGEVNLEGPCRRGDGADFRTLASSYAGLWEPSQNGFILYLFPSTEQEQRRVSESPEITNQQPSTHGAGTAEE